MNAFITLNKSSLLLDEPVYSSERGNFKTKCDSYNLSPSKFIWNRVFNSFPYHFYNIFKNGNNYTHYVYFSNIHVIIEKKNENVYNFHI